jgi:hypothetical protein
MEGLHTLRIHRQDILSLLTELRPCIRFPHIPEQDALLKEALPCLGLTAKIFRPEQIGVECVYIVKHKSYLKELFEFLESTKDDARGEWHIKHGEMLGYPDCCCRSHAESVHRLPYPCGPLDWKLNHLLNMETKVKHDEKHLIEQMHRGGYRWGYYLIPHIPCSFHCAKSREYSEMILKHLRESFEDVAEELMDVLKNPILSIDTYRFIIFDGTVKDNTLTYSGIIDMNNLTEEDLLKDLRQCTHFVKSGSKLSMYKDSTLHKQIELRARLYNFC